MSDWDNSTWALTRFGAQELADVLARANAGEPHSFRACTDGPCFTKDYSVRVGPVPTTFGLEDGWYQSPDSVGLLYVADGAAWLVYVRCHVEDGQRAAFIAPVSR